MDRHWGPRLEKGSGGGGVGHLEDKEVSIVWDLVGRRVVLACVSPSPEYEGFSIYVSCRQIALLSSKDLPVGDIDTLICGLTLACLNIEILKHALDFSYKTWTKRSFGLPTNRGHLSAVN